MIQGSLTNAFRLVVPERIVFSAHQRCLPSGSRPKRHRNIAIQASHTDTNATTLKATDKQNGFRREPENSNAIQKVANEQDNIRRELAKAFKYNELQDILTNELASPYRVWGCYSDYCSVYGPENLTLDTHSIALRKCVPPTMQVRMHALRKMQEGQWSEVAPHMWEYRFQSIIRWVYMSGFNPSLDDFHFILEQFAVTGHFRGSRSILKELDRLEIPPTYITYGLCLKAAAHRLKLPCEEGARANLILEASSLCMDILESMAKSNTPCTPVNLDLCVRILKESVDVQAFEKFLEIGYGIDLSYPDQPPLKSLMRVSTGEEDQLDTRLPFSTYALTTAIDVLGKRKLLSRMIVAFETLSKPLDRFYSSASRDFDDDDDWPSFTEDSSLKPPHADPNTTTYSYLIKHCAHAGSFTLARHYVLEIFELDKQADQKLREDLASKPFKTVEAPRLAITRATILPIFGLSSRNKHLPLIDWVLRLCEEAVSRKKDALNFFSDLSLKEKEEADQSEMDATDKDLSTEADFDTKNHSSVLDFDLNDLNPSSAYRRPFDRKLHMNLLRKDLREIESLHATAKEARDRLSSRIKERLRRRIWNGKDIYLVSLNDRVVLPRHSWKSIAIPLSDVETQTNCKLTPGRGGRKPGTPYFTPSYGREYIVD